MLKTLIKLYIHPNILRKLFRILFDNKATKIVQLVTSQKNKVDDCTRGLRAIIIRK